MLFVKEPKASCSFGFDFINVTFKIEDSREDIYDYKFSLWRAVNNTTNFEQVLDQINNFECNDYDVNLKNPQITYNYFIKVENLLTGEESKSEIFKLNTPTIKDEYVYFFNEIQQIYLSDVINNSDFILLKRMRTGERCDCYDDVRGTSKTSRCKKCFGVGFKGGYYLNGTIKICLFNPPTRSEKFEPTDIVEDLQPFQAWTTAYPLLQVGDILINSETKERFVIVNWNGSVKNEFLVRQTVQIQRIPRGSMLQDIPV